MKVIYPEGPKDLKEAIEEGKKKTEGFLAVNIKNGKYSSQYLVFIKTAEQPHYHADHDLSVYLIEGKGTIYLDGKTYTMEAGDFLFIPAGTVHFYTNSAEISVILATFSPQFDGKDVVKVEIK